MKCRCTGLILVLLLGCRGNVSSDVAAVRRVIESHNASIARWYAEGQIDSIVAVFAEDVWQMPPNSPPLVGRDSVRAFWKAATGWGHWQFDFHVEDVMTNGPLAAERGSYTLKFTAGPQSPMPSTEDRGNYVVLWRHEADGQWRIVWDAPVSVMPPARPTGT